MSKGNSEAKVIISNAGWRFAERISAQLVSFFVSIILARLLLPEEYGTVAITTVFITICNVFVTSGFGAALIQKKEADEVDFSTILFAGVGFSLILYVIIFFLAHYIALFYNLPILENVLRVMALRLPIAAINSVQQAFVARKMIFKKFFWATFIGTVVSAIIGVFLAYLGFGVWALVAQYLSNSFIDTIVLGGILQWKPVFKVSFKRFKELVGFGWRLLCSDLLHTIYTQLRSLIIGKQYLADQLAFYNKGQQIPHLFVTNVGVAISSVLFPAMSTEQDNKGKLRQMLLQSVSVGTFIMMPIMFGLIAVAKPLIILLLTDKWILAVPFLQMACLEFCLEPWATANLQAIKAQGAGKVYLKMEYIKKAIAMTLLLCSIHFGVYGIAASGIVYSMIDLLIDMAEIRNLMNIGIFEQLKTVFPHFMNSFIMTLIVYALSYLKFGNAITLILQVVVGMVTYIVLSILTKNPWIKFVVKILMSHKRTNKHVEE